MTQNAKERLEQERGNRLVAEENLRLAEWQRRAEPILQRFYEYAPRMAELGLDHSEVMEVSQEDCSSSIERHCDFEERHLLGLAKYIAGLLSARGFNLLLRKDTYQTCIQGTVIDRLIMEASWA
jgi:hypothetical protein